MNIQHKESNNLGSFYIEQDGEMIAEMAYRRVAANKIIIDHTEVDESLQGQGVAMKLVTAGVDYARANDQKVGATCTYALSVFKRKEEFKDVFDNSNEE